MMMIRFLLLEKAEDSNFDLFFYSRADYGRSLNEIESSLPTEIEAREAAVDKALFDRTAKFLSTHTVELNLGDESSRSLEEGM